MSDWMSELKDAANAAFGEGGLDEKTSELVFAIARIVGEYGWHPVTKPPEKEDYYLVCFYVSGQAPRTAISWFRGGSFQLANVYAWMPKPEPRELHALLASTPEVTHA